MVAEEGGGGSRAGKTLITWDYVATIDGRTPQVSGYYTITTYITTVNSGFRLRNCNLADGTVVSMTLTAVDWFTGLSWPSVTFSGVVSGSGINVDALGVYTSVPGGVPIITSATITDSDGNVIARGH